MPIFANAGIKRIINGAIPHTPDGNPLVGPAPGLRNFWQCCGAAIGIAQGAGTGKYLAQWMVHGDSEINMHSIDPRRFGAYANPDYTRAMSFDDYENMFETPLPGREIRAGRPNRITPLYELFKAKARIIPRSLAVSGRSILRLTGSRKNCNIAVTMSLTLWPLNVVSCVNAWASWICRALPSLKCLAVVPRHCLTI